MLREMAVADDTEVRALRAHPMVDSARRAAEGVIEVVPRTEVATEVAGWRYLFEDMYDGSADAGPAADASLVGWVDSFTGSPLPAEQMHEWVAASVGRIRRLRPRRLLEIGAGTGLIMRELLAGGDLSDYIGTDFAESSVAILRSIADEMAGQMTGQMTGQLAGQMTGQLAGGMAGGMVRATRVSTATAPADEAPAAVDGTVDTVILNSVVQYFPDVRYLETVIGRVLEVVEPGGHVFLGDLRDATLLGEFYRRRHRSRGTSAEFALEQNERADFELSLVPEYVRSLAARFPAVTAVEVSPRRGRYANEMALFRFDAVLHVGCPPPRPFSVRVRTGAVSAAGLSRFLTACGGADLRWQDIGNARVIAAADAADPEAIWALDGVAGWRVRVGVQPGSGGDRLEVWGSPPDGPGGPGGPGEHFALSWPHAPGPAAYDQPPLPPGAGWALRDALASHAGDARITLASQPGDARITLACAHASDTELAR